MVDDTQTAAPAGQELATLPAPVGLQRLVIIKQQQLSMHYALFMEGGDEESLHDFRVSLRRLRSLLSNYCMFIECDSLPRELLREMQRNTNHARDLDVFIPQLRRHHPRPLQLIHELESTRQHSYRQLHQKLPGVWGKLTTDIPALLKFRQRESDLIFGVVTAEAGRRQLKRIKKQFRALHHKWDEARLHRLRIAAKRLRYLLEPFSDEPLLYNAIEQMKHFQDELGEYRDRQQLLHYMQSERPLDASLITSLQTQVLQLRGTLKVYRKKSARNKLVKPLRSAIRQFDKYA